MRRLFNWLKLIFRRRRAPIDPDEMHKLINDFVQQRTGITEYALGMPLEEEVFGLGDK